MLVALLLALGVAGCEEGADTAPLVVVPRGGDLVGMWTGTEEVTGATDVVSGVDGGIEEGVKFRVALRLRSDRAFRLWVSNFPVAGQTESRVCEGVYDLDGNILEFFPESVCRALPLSRFSIGRAFPDELTLDARTNRTTRTSTTGSVRVFMRLERD